MAVSGTGPFSSDEAIAFLRGLAEEPPEQRAAALERLFRSVDNRPGPIGRELSPDRVTSPDQVVAAAAVVGAVSLGGNQFRDALAALAGEDPALDAGLPEPVKGLARTALEALTAVAGPWRLAGPWRRERPKDAEDTIAALSQVLHLGGGVLDDLDKIWNAACGGSPEGSPPGIQHLGHLLRVHNCVMSGGLAFAMEMNEPFHVALAIDALRYFDLNQAADRLADVLARSQNDEPCDSWPTDDFLDGLIDGDVIDPAFRTKAKQTPADFGRA